MIVIYKGSKSDIQKNGVVSSSTSLVQNRYFPKLKHSQLSILQQPNANMNVVGLEQGTVEDKNSAANNKHLSLQAHSTAVEKHEVHFPFLNRTSNHMLSHLQIKTNCLTAVQLVI